MLTDSRACTGVSATVMELSGRFGFRSENIDEKAGNRISLGGGKGQSGIQLKLVKTGAPFSVVEMVVG